MRTRLLKVLFIVSSILVLSTISLARRQESGENQIQIVDSRLGKDVKDRMVVEEDSTFAKNSAVFLWMKLTGGSSDQITVTWKNGDYSHETTLMIGGSPWRTLASKTVRTSGDWTVTVTDAKGNVLKEMSFKVE